MIAALGCAKEHALLLYAGHVICKPLTLDACASSLLYSRALCELCKLHLQNPLFIQEGESLLVVGLLAHMLRKAVPPHSLNQRPKPGSWIS
ncbi:uncharacterized protein MYCFIDRAFT_167095 [Pseudocercospora fijiensis CIRAD86]|uniref:Uncharacterized protein n=1 Tax=Pseudocercospora fijiensis (strain CIRAD86) TaxID=383855 RepID=M2ZJD2_PSEFD|nr:uncharacterized protein MYCFIDRAFT_167095 [Pseudocercospora fijiensis CIRAD86]EME79199.1 hypothetical protein MYCFIDRAFT_167095 [Pseudocercospora fijiensis CIRAD86]